MKLLLSTLFAAALVMTPSAAEAQKPRTASACSGVQAVEVRDGVKVTKSYMACPQKTRAKKPRLVTSNPWG